MGEDNIIQEFKLKNIEEIKKYFTKEINQNELMSKNINMVSSVLDYTEHFLFSVSVITECVSVFLCFCFCFFSWYSNRNH